MVRIKWLLPTVVLVVVVAGAIAWFQTFQQQTARQHRTAFFGTARPLPTSGGREMRPEW